MCTYIAGTSFAYPSSDVLNSLVKGYVECSVV